MDDLRRRARNAYELGRVERALPWALYAVVLTGIAVAVGSTSAWVAGPLLALLLIGLRWLGGDVGDAVPTGLSAGSLAYALPLMWEAGADCCTTSCSTECLAVCIAGGLGAGSLLLSASWRNAWSMRGLLAGWTVTCLTASLGCLMLGMTGLYGLAAIAVVALPAGTLRAAGV